jgi:hypothetical protein
VVGEVLQLKRRVGECVYVGETKLTHIEEGGRRGVLVECPGQETFALFLGEPKSQWRFGILTDAVVLRGEATPRRINRVFTPKGTP